ncbi:hypothetical protein BsWGS_06229 [Bradybaena similaris]
MVISLILVRNRSSTVHRREPGRTSHCTKPEVSYAWTTHRQKALVGVAARQSFPAGRPSCPVGRPPCPVGRPPCPAGRPFCPAGRSPCPVGSIVCYWGMLNGLCKQAK